MVSGRPSQHVLHADTWLSSRQGALMVEGRACQNVPPPRPALSVLIATYNRAALLDRTLRSLLEGVVERPDDIVIVNGGCDRTSEVVTRPAAAGAPIRLIQVVHVGLSA